MVGDLVLHALAEASAILKPFLEAVAVLTPDRPQQRINVIELVPEIVRDKSGRVKRRPAAGRVIRGPDLKDHVGRHQRKEQSNDYGGAVVKPRRRVLERIALR